MFLLKCRIATDAWRRPIEPDVRRILLMTLVLGLGLGCGLAYLMEMMDTSFKTPEEAEKELQLPVLVSVPFYYTDQEVRNQKVKEFLKAASVAIGFVICAVGIGGGLIRLSRILAGRDVVAAM